jgi:hypothetical protein
LQPAGASACAQPAKPRAANINILHWAAVAAIAHSQAVEKSPKRSVWSSPSHELLACESLKSSQTGGGEGDGGGAVGGASGGRGAPRADG